jgi:hypothetical protein
MPYRFKREQHPGLICFLAAGGLKWRRGEGDPHDDSAPQRRGLRELKAQTATTDIPQRLLLARLILKPDLDGDISGMPDEAAHGSLRLDSIF